MSHNRLFRRVAWALVGCFTGRVAWRPATVRFRRRAWPSAAQQTRQPHGASPLSPRYSPPPPSLR
eukprot:6888271-Lingulodinium_polyedra.AAC.1